jgi:hypothetical protein
MSRKPAETSAQQAKHSKGRILTSKRFTAIEKDFLRGLLRDDELYTVDEAAQLLEKYLKQEAK